MLHRYKMWIVLMVFLCAMNSSINVYASQTISGNDLDKVELPTVSDELFSYIMDPQNLIKKTNAAKYGGASFGEGNLFFKNEEMRYSNTSNPVEITNYGSDKLEVTVRVNLSISDEILLAEDSCFDDESCSLYLALKTEAEEIPILQQGDMKYAEFTTLIPASDGETASSFSFSLTGACNSMGDWATVSNTDSIVDITWTVVPIVEGDFVEVEMLTIPVKESAEEVEETTVEETEVEGMGAEEIMEEETDAEGSSEEEIIEEETGVEDSSEEIVAEDADVEEVSVEEIESSEAVEEEAVVLQAETRTEETTVTSSETEPINAEPGSIE